MIKQLLKFSYYLAILWTSIIFILCCTPGQYIPSTHWLELLSFDKFVHLGIFFVLIILWFLALYQANKLTTSITFITVMLGITYGGVLEIMQATVFSNRSGDWFDFIANATGCILGWWLFSKNKKRLDGYF